MWFAKRPFTSKEVPDGDGMWVGSASATDHPRHARGRLGRGVAGPDRAANRARFRRWLRDDVARRANGEVALAVEGCTGWRYVVEEIAAAGFEAYVAEPVDTQAARGRQHRAKTDRTDARLLRDLLAAGELPESWIPPEPVLEWRERVRLYKSLVDQRTVCQRIHAELYQHGVAVPEGAIRSDKTRDMLADPNQFAPALGLAKVVRPRFAAGAPP